jgi:flavin-dependent dehydrogenase
MDRCDVLIVGGGPAGSTCAWKLRQAGCDVLVVDRAPFPRDKPCAGWITPQVVADLDLDLEAYRRGRTLQPISGFRTGLIGRPGTIETVYGAPVSYGIRRCEFDHYLLQRSGARTRLGEPVTRIRREGSAWVVNDSIAAPMLVGAGGHFCPVARWLNGTRPGGAPLVVAQETEFALDAGEAAVAAETPGVPELYFCPDLGGYGWSVRKDRFLNVGFGHLRRHSLPRATADFVRFLAAGQRTSPRGPWRGHAYLVSQAPRRRAVDSGVVLVGDAAGLALPSSGEGIRPAIESGMLAAATIAGAEGCYTQARLDTYRVQAASRFGGDGVDLYRALPPGLKTRLAAGLLALPWFVRHVLLERWFLRAHEPALSSP